MLESPKVEGGGSTTAVRSTYFLAMGSPEEGGGGSATPEEDSTLGRLKLAFIWVTLYLRNVAPMGAIMCTGSEAGNSSNPRCNKIRWIKTRKKRPYAVELLLWT